MPKISRITLYPIKSLPGVDVERAEFTASGSLMHDRAFAIVDDSGAYVNGKADANVHKLQLRCDLDGDITRVRLTVAGQESTHALDPAAAFDGMRSLADRLSLHFGRRVRMLHNVAGGFPDDTDSPGPTIVSSASLNDVAAWYPGQSLTDMRARFRANIELGECESFWEDRLYGEPGVARAFSIGSVELLGINPCKRCVVPSRHPSTGIALAGFQRTFVRNRQTTLPTWAHPARFDFFYRLGVNTRPATSLEGKSIAVGDAVALV